MYTINTPVERPVWKNHEIIGRVTCSLNDKDYINSIQHEIYLGFTEEEHRLLSYGTEAELKAAGL